MKKAIADAQIAQRCGDRCISSRTAAEKFKVPLHTIQDWFRRGHIAGHRVPTRKHPIKKPLDPVWFRHRPQMTLHVYADAEPVTVPCRVCRGTGKMHPAGNSQTTK